MMKLFNILKCLLNNTIPCPVTPCTDILNTFYYLPILFFCISTALLSWIFLLENINFIQYLFSHYFILAETKSKTTLKSCVNSDYPFLPLLFLFSKIQQASADFCLHLSMKGLPSRLSMATVLPNKMIASLSSSQ